MFVSEGSKFYMTVPFFLVSFEFIWQCRCVRGGWEGIWQVYGESAQFEELHIRRGIMRLLLPLLYILSILTKIKEASDPAMPFVEYLDQNHLVGLRWGFAPLGGALHSDWQSTQPAGSALASVRVEE